MIQNFVFTIYNSSLQYNFNFTIYAGSVQEFIAVQFHHYYICNAGSVQQFIAVQFRLYYICRVCTRVHCSTISSLLYMPGLYKSSLQYNFIFTTSSGSVQQFIALQFRLYYICRVFTRIHCSTILFVLTYQAGLYNNS